MYNIKVDDNGSVFSLSSLKLNLKNLQRLK